MKDVGSIIKQRLKRLDSHFSLFWQSDFEALILFLKSNPKNSQIVKGIEEEKIKEHLPLMSSFERLLEDGRRCLRQILNEIKCFPNLSIKQDIEDLSRMKLSKEKLLDPFFELESFYSDYYRQWVGVLRKIVESGEEYSFLAQYAIISSFKVYDTVHIQIDLSFSKNLRTCETEVSNLSGKRSIAMWEKWDLILKWGEWTKNGIAPDNEYCKKNLGHLFDGLKIGSAVQSVGLYFIEKLISDQPSSAVLFSIQAIELFLDAQDRYWIITHTYEKGHDRNPYFIKKLQNGSKPHRLLKLLLETEPGSSIDFEKLPHALGELEIKNGLERAFFPFGSFMGLLC